MLRNREWRKLLSEELKICYKLSDTSECLNKGWEELQHGWGKTIERQTAREDG
jgi:hypothetical protein